MGKHDPWMTTPPRLCYTSLPTKREDPIGMATPPFRPPASIPFLWEEAPGKPKAPLLPTDFSFSPFDDVAAKYDGMASPTAVLDWPCGMVLPMDYAKSTAFDGPSILMGSSREKSLSFSVDGGRGRKVGRGKDGLVWLWRRVGGGGRSSGATVAATDVSGRRHSCCGSESGRSFRFYIGEVVVDGGGGGGGGREEEGRDETKVSLTRWRRNGNFSSFWKHVVMAPLIPWRRGRRSKKVTSTPTSTAATARNGLVDVTCDTHRTTLRALLK